MFNIFGKKTQTITAQEGTFVKKDGTQRRMKFTPLTELKEQGLMPRHIGNSGKTSVLSEGLIRVWDWDSNGIRIFNKKTQIGELKTTTVDVTEHKSKYNL